MDPNQPSDINEAPGEYVAQEVPVSSELPLKKIISLVVGVVAIIAIILIVVLIILPRISGGNNKNVNLVYWGAFEDTAPLEDAAAAFHAKHPNVTVSIQNQDVKALKNYYTRLTTRIKNGNGPDVFRYHESWLPELLPYLSPLPQGLVAAANIEKNYYPTVTADLKYQGAYYGIPIHFDSLALFVNTELFKNGGISEYPTNWDDLYTVAKQLTVKDDASGRITQSGISIGTYDNVEHASDIVSLLLVQNGANLTNLSSTKQNASDALDFYTNFAKGDSKVWDENQENSKIAFSKGKVAMYIGYSWDIFEIKQQSPTLPFVIVPVPHLGARDATIASYWVEGISSKTKYPKESVEFLQFLTTRQMMEELYAKESKIRLFGELYPRSDMASLLKDNALIYPFVQQGPDAKSTIFASNTYDGAMTDELNKYLGDAVRSVLNNTSSETAVESLAQGVQQKFTQYAGQEKK